MDDQYVPAVKVADPRFPWRGAIWQPDPITQEMIRRYLTLEVEHKRFGAHKRELVRMLEEHAKVEPGRYDLELVTSECRRLTTADLIRALDLSDDFVATLRARAPVQKRRYLRIR